MCVLPYLYQTKFDGTRCSLGGRYGVDVMVALAPTGDRNSTHIPEPAQVLPRDWGSGPGQKQVTSVSAEHRHICAVVSDGTLWCWWNGRHGQLGSGKIVFQDTPVQVLPNDWGSGPDQKQVTSVSAGRSHTCTLLSDGTLWCWGKGKNGQLGLGVTCGEDAPVQVLPKDWGSGPNQKPVTSVSAGRSHTCAVVSDGTLWCWGENGSGQLGVAAEYATYRTMQVLPNDWGSGPGQKQVTSVSAGHSHTCAVVSDGTLWCWGKGRPDSRTGTPRYMFGLRHPIATTSVQQQYDCKFECRVTSLPPAASFGIVLGGQPRSPQCMRGSNFREPNSLQCNTFLYPDWPADATSGSAAAQDSNSAASWSGLLAAHASPELGSNVWMLDPLFKQVLPAWKRFMAAWPGMHVALGGARLCTHSASKHRQWEVLPSVLDADFGWVSSINSSRMPNGLRPVFALADMVCGNWQPSALFSDLSLASASFQAFGSQKDPQHQKVSSGIVVMPLHAPVSFRLLGAMVPGGGTVPSSGGTIMLYVHPAPTSSSNVSVMVLASYLRPNMGFHTCTGLTVGRGYVACSMPPGRDWKAVCMEVDGQRAQECVYVPQERSEGIILAA